MKKINEFELKKIFEDIKNGNPNGIELLYKNYHNLIYGIAFSILKNKENSEDVTQNVFAKILKLNQEQIPTQGETSWIYTVTKNEAIQFIRKQKQIVDIDDLYSLESETNEINNVIDMEAYYNLIKDLKPIDKEIISLKILSDFTFDKIAEMLNIPLGTVEWRYYKALHCIKLSLANLSAFIIVFTVWESYKIMSSSTHNTKINENKVNTSTQNTYTNSSFSFEDIEIENVIKNTSDDTGAADSISNPLVAIANLGINFACLLFIILSIYFAFKKKKRIKKELWK